MPQPPSPDTAHSALRTPHFTVRFVAQDVSVKARRGETILDVARKAGVFIDSLCGGEFACGKCKVRVVEGNVEAGHSDFLSEEEVSEGWVLACEVWVHGDLDIEVPVASTGLQPAAEIDAGAATLDPLARQVALSVPPPTLENNSPDQERLERALHGETGKTVTGTSFREKRAKKRSCHRFSPAAVVDLDVLRALPQALRADDGHVVATTALRGDVDEVIDVRPGRKAEGAFGVAVDLGTTTVVAHLLDLSSGETLATALKPNSQAPYGADVIRRIIWCDANADGLDRLHHATIDDVNSLIQEITGKSGIETRNVNALTVAGNTTMMHLLLGIDPAWIRREPYSGATYRTPPLNARALGLDIHPRGILYCLPSVGAFVGADITAGVMAAGFDQTDRLRMLIDVGTNGEIVIGNRDWLVCASASAGPAFEGAGNRDGMRALPGAVDHVRQGASGEGLECSTVGAAPPAGLCGTAYVDALAELLRMGVMDKTGNLHPEAADGRVRPGSDETAEFVLVRAGENEARRDLVLTQNDIANLLRAKGAIYAAAKTLLKSLGLKFSDVEELLVAGAFGSRLDLRNAVAIGLLPDLPRDRLRFAGNTSLSGAKMAAFSARRYAEAARIAAKMTYFELSVDPSFMDEFTSACFFPHTHVEEFPSVMSELGQS
jgi:uncharacterized 2Fe-2S/4Fe-4S cluster protein (DUF4445 family)